MLDLWPSSPLIYEVAKQSELTAVLQPTDNPFDRQSSGGVIVSVGEVKKFDKTGVKDKLRRK